MQMRCTFIINSFIPYFIYERVDIATPTAQPQRTHNKMKGTRKKTHTDSKNIIKKRAIYLFMNCKLENEERKHELPFFPILFQCIFLAQKMLIHIFFYPAVHSIFVASLRLCATTPHHTASEDCQCIIL